MEQQRCIWRSMICSLFIFTVLIVTGCGSVEGVISLPEAQEVRVGDVAFKVEVADTTPKRVRGLSGRESLPPQTGMLFVFDDGRASAFWMKDMLFPLDFVWIGADCTVVDITENVPNPAPDTPDSALPIYESAAPAAYNLEINAGEAAQFGLKVGDEASFSNITSEQARC
jgi:uncharacterized membrane protein (UPF0127 family)